MRISYLLFLFGIGMMMVGSVLYNEYPEQPMKLYNITNQMYWNNTYNEEVFEQVEGYYDINEINNKRFINILNKAVDTFGYISFEVSKWGIEYGYSHPEIDFKLVFKIMVGLIILSLLHPIILLLGLIYYGIKECINKLWRKKDGDK